MVPSEQLHHYLVATSKNDGMLSNEDDGYWEKIVLVRAVIDHKKPF